MRAELSLHNDIAEFSRLVEFATDFGHRCGLPPGELGRLLVLVDELFSNVVRHGYGEPRTDGTIVIALSLDEDRLGIEVTDDGRPFDPLQAELSDIDQPPLERPIGGLGLRFVRELADQAEYVHADGRNRFTLSRHVKR